MFSFVGTIYTIQNSKKFKFHQTIQFATIQVLKLFSLFIYFDYIKSNILTMTFTWHASWPSSPPAQKLLAGRMNIFSVTALIFLTHSLSLTTGTWASLTRSGIGPAGEERTNQLDYILGFHIVQEVNRLGEYRKQIGSNSWPSVRMDKS